MEGGADGALPWGAPGALLTDSAAPGPLPALGCPLGATPPGSGPQEAPAAALPAEIVFWAFKNV